MAINFNGVISFFLFAVIDCTVSEWGVWSECDVSCGTGMMSRTRSILNAPENGGKHCPSLVQKRGCQGFKCHGQRDRRVLRGMYLLHFFSSTFVVREFKIIRWLPLCAKIVEYIKFIKIKM